MKFKFYFMACLLSWANLLQAQSPYPLERVLALSIQSSINPSTLNYFENAVTEAQSKSYDAILVRLNTPGGLVMTTKSILTVMGNSPVPFIVWVAPDGASATSAGAIISSGAHFLFMAPGTNIGAATPIEMSGDLTKDLRLKAVNDLVALVKGLSQEHERNAEAFAEMISKASSYSAQEAKEKKVIDGVVSNYHEMWAQLSGKTFSVQGAKKQIHFTSAPQVSDFSMSLGQKILDTLANPSLTYILFLLGAGLIYFEVQAAGGFIAGSIGATLLVLSGIGFEILPLNFGAFALIILAFIFFLLEMFVTSYGLLTVAGLVGLTVGSLFLFNGDQGSIHLGLEVIFSAAFAILVFMLFILFFITKKNGQKASFFSLVGRQGVVENILGAGLYQIKVNGELWQARAEEGQDLSLGQSIVVTAQETQKLELKVRAQKERTL